MPKENKVRSRRGEKRKRKDQQDEEGFGVKRQKSTDAEELDFLREGDSILNDNSIFNGEGDENQQSNGRPFFGLLDDEEQEYFRRADELLELNDFPSLEERAMFLENVYKEADGKELKIANSQSCSRLMERLIMLSTTKQKKKLFGVFSGHFPHLIQHRFASHCCESLFIHAAPVVTAELEADLKNGSQGDFLEDGKDGTYVSVENLFLYTLNELEGQMTFLLTDRFASHTLRVLLVVLSGRPLGQASTQSLLQSKQKEKIGISGMNVGYSLEKRTVPESFDFAVKKIISDTVVGLDNTFIHILATHPTGNPTLQLLVELELTQVSKNTDEKTIMQALLPDDPSSENSKSASFINGLVYDTLGSRLLETIVRFSPGKLFKSIYRSTFKERMGALSRNETASFVVIRVLDRLSKEDLEAAITDIVPQIPGLIERHRTNVIKTVFERSQARGAVEGIRSLTKAIEEAYGSDPSTLLSEMTCLKLEESDEKTQPQSSATTHGSLLAQSLLSIPGPPSTLLQTGLLTLSSPELLKLSTISSTSHILQVAFTSPSPSSASTTSTESLLTFRRKLANKLLFPDDDPSQAPIRDLALSPSGTHVLDSIATFTSSLPSLTALKERIMAVLLSYETLLRDDYSGRIVWRNWMCELFKRNKVEWIGKMRGLAPVRSVPQGSSSQKQGAQGSRNGQRWARGGSGLGGKNESGKTAIELARSRFAVARQSKDGKTRGFRKATGANAIGN